MRNIADNPLALVLILGLFAVLFGGKRLPDAARGLGRSLRIFKSEVKQMHDDDKDPAPAAPVEGRIVADPVVSPLPTEPVRTEQVRTKQTRTADGPRVESSPGESRDSRA